MRAVAAKESTDAEEEGHCDAPQHPEGGKVRISGQHGGFPEKASTFEEEGLHR